MGSGDTENIITRASIYNTYTRELQSINTAGYQACCQIDIQINGGHKVKAVIFSQAVNKNILAPIIGETINIIATAALEIVVSVAAFQDIVACPAIYAVIAAATLNNIGTVVAD
jgi:hypothetical protein